MGRCIFDEYESVRAVVQYYICPSYAPTYAGCTNFPKNGGNNTFQLLARTHFCIRHRSGVRVTGAVHSVVCFEPAFAAVEVVAVKHLKPGMVMRRGILYGLIINTMCTTYTRNVMKYNYYAIKTDFRKNGRFWAQIRNEDT